MHVHICNQRNSVHLGKSPGAKNTLHVPRDIVYRCTVMYAYVFVYVCIVCRYVNLYVKQQPHVLYIMLY